MFHAGIQGFARLCPGDVFEVTLKHGTQKWKSRGRVCKDNTQTWDNQRTVIKGLIGEMVSTARQGGWAFMCGWWCLDYEYDMMR